ncbi:hypothetical protein [Nitrosopumilus ureiphilus]|nr:hypothetical protein [Nitrosopumilus ureiphilus]
MAVVLGFFLILTPTTSSIDATHNSNNNKEARKQSEATSKEINTQKIERKNKIELAFKNYREAFTSWKIIKDTWKIVKNSGDAEKILQTKNLLDKAINVKTTTWNEYLVARNSK